MTVMHFEVETNELLTFDLPGTTLLSTMFRRLHAMFKLSLAWPSLA